MSKIRACWNPNEVDTFIRTAALAQRPVFMAVHTPIHDFRVERGDLPEATDEALFDRLFATRHRNMTVVVGDPGSGKSHLIQWLQYRWERSAANNDVVVLVPRSDGSLAGTLARLKSALDARYAEPLRNLAVQPLAVSAQVQLLLDNLGRALNTEAYARAADIPDYATRLSEEHAYNWFRSHKLQGYWKPAIHLVEQLSAETIGGTAGTRDQAVSRFTVLDLVQFVDLLKYDNEIRKNALFRRLQSEVESSIQNAHVPDGPNHLQVLEELERQVPAATEFVAAINAAIPRAIQGLLGLTPGQLTERLDQVRKMLRADGKRLVLLLEDITNLRGVDGDLVEALLRSSQEQPEFCDLVAVIGVTPDYYRSGHVAERASPMREDHVVARTDLIIRLTEVDEDRSKRETKFLREPSSRASFVARYMNAVRNGVEGAITADSSGTVQNACEFCPDKEVCHAIFPPVSVPGLRDKVSLFPLTQWAIETFWQCLEDPTSGVSSRTPRGLLKSVVAPVLKAAAALDSGQFPPHSVGSSVHISGRRGIHHAARRRMESLAARMGAERAERVIAWWGDTKTGDVNEDILAVFCGDEVLSHKGEGKTDEGTDGKTDEGTEGKTDEGTDGKTDEGTEGKKDKGTDGKTDEGTDGKKDKGTDGKTDEGTDGKKDEGTEGKKGTEPVLPPPVDPNVEHLLAWAQGQDMEVPGPWEVLLRDVVKEIHPEHQNRQAELWYQIFTRENTVLTTTRLAPSKIRFEVGPSPIVELGLLALYELENSQDVPSPGLSLEAFGHVVALQLHVAKLAIEHYDDVQAMIVAKLGGGIDEFLAATCAIGWTLDHAGQTVPVDCPLDEIWPRCFVQDGGEVERMTDWTNLSALWRKRTSLVDRSASTVADRVRGSALKYLAVGPRSRSGESPKMLDPNPIHVALGDVFRGVPPSFRTGAELPKFGTALENELNFYRSIQASSNGWARVIDAEFGAILKFCDDIQKAVGPRALETFCADVQAFALESSDNFVNELINQADLVEWARAYAKLPKGAEARAELFDAVDKFRDTEPAGSAETVPPDTKLRMCLAAPRSQMALAADLARVGTRLVTLAHDRAERWKAAGGEAELAEILTRLTEIEAVLAAVAQHLPELVEVAHDSL